MFESGFKPVTTEVKTHKYVQIGRSLNSIQSHRAIDVLKVENCRAHLIKIYIYSTLTENQNNFFLYILI